MFYIESKSTNPAWNLALEEYVFSVLSARGDFFMLWQNDNTIVVGKHQNTATEVNAEFVKEHGIQVVRRLSGGGAVYHDLGNLNFTFVTTAEEGEVFDFANFCLPVVEALAEMGVVAEVSGRNDMTIDGKKFSGNSQYARGKKVLHHGTLLFDSDLSIVGQALNVSDLKLRAKGLSSVKSRVTNISEYLTTKWTVSEFKAKLRDFFRERNALVEYALSEEDLREIEKIRASRYATWEWNYGTSPDYEILKKRRVEGVGEIQVWMDVQKGVLKNLRFFGDFFGNGEVSVLEKLLEGTPFLEEALAKTLLNINVSVCFQHLRTDDFISLLLL